MKDCFLGTYLRAQPLIGLVMREGSLSARRGVVENIPWSGREAWVGDDGQVEAGSERAVTSGGLLPEAREEGCLERGRGHIRPETTGVHRQLPPSGSAHACGGIAHPQVHRAAGRGSTNPATVRRPLCPFWQRCSRSRSNIHALPLGLPLGIRQGDFS